MSLQMLCPAIRLAAAAVALGLIASSVSAANGGADFARDPGSYIGREVKVAKLGCFSSSPAAGLRCTTYKGVYVLAADVAPAALKTKILAECGGIVEAEDDPSCLFDATFTPTAIRKGKGSVTRGDSSVETQVWMVEAGRVTLAPHR